MILKSNKMTGQIPTSDLPKNSKPKKCEIDSVKVWKATRKKRETIFKPTKKRVFLSRFF